MNWFQGFFCRCMPTVEFPPDEGEDEQFVGLIEESSWGGRAIEAPPRAAHHEEEQPARRETKPTTTKSDVDEIKIILSIVEQIRKRPSLSKSELIVELRKMLEAFGGGAEEEDSGKEKEKGKRKVRDEKGRKEKQEGDLLRQVVVRNVLNWGRDEIIHREKHNLLNAFVSPLIEALDNVQQQELYVILRYMPSAVLGDELAREQTRVFMDVTQDVRESQRLEKGKVAHKSKMVEVVSGVITELIQALGPGEEAAVFVALLMALEQPQAMRLVMEQLLLVPDWIPNDTEKRGSLLGTLLRDSITFNVK